MSALHDEYRVTDIIHYLTRDKAARVPTLLDREVRVALERVGIDVVANHVLSSQSPTNYMSLDRNHVSTTSYQL